MRPEEFLRRLSEVRIFRQRDHRAPHKPLLLLFALGRVAGGEDRLVSFQRVDQRLSELFRTFGSPRSKRRAVYPFARLRNDGLWEIPGFSALYVNRSGDLNARELRERGIRGGLPAEVYELLESNPWLISTAAQHLLAKHFSPSLHHEILEAVGIAPNMPLWDPMEVMARKGGKVRERDPKFRREVLREYEEHCAVCDHHLKLDDRLLGLEAAHIKWHSHEGPDEVQNGLALCPLHHRALDRGALGLKRRGNNFKILISSKVGGDSPAAAQLLDHSGNPIRPPKSRELAPDPHYVGWHRHQVFRGPPRR